MLTLSVPFCLSQTTTGTGLRNVKGLLRRPEAGLLVQKMQNGELQPGELHAVFWVEALAVDLLLPPRRLLALANANCVFTLSAAAV